MTRMNLALAFALLLLLLSSSTVAAQPAVPWSTIDGGGGQCVAGPYAVTGTAGQADAGQLAGGAFVLLGGFWQPLTAPAGNASQQLFLPLIARAP